MRGLYWLVTDQHNAMTLPKFVRFHYPPSPHTTQHSLHRSKFHVFQQSTRTSATVLKLYILYVVQKHIQYNTREISHFYSPYCNTQLHNVLVMGGSTNFEMSVVKLLHSMFLASHILKYWVMQYAILNFPYLMCVCVWGCVRAWACVRVCVVHVWACVRVCARAWCARVHVCVCVCTRIKGFFRIWSKKTSQRKTELQHNASTNTDSIYRTVNCNKKCKHNLTWSLYGFIL